MASDPPLTVLVPVAIMEGQAVPDALVDLLSAVPVVLLGYHVVPEQTAPGQARAQFEDTAQAALAELATSFEDRGGVVETRLVFTHDAEQTFERVADEETCDAVALVNPAPTIERVLVAVRGLVNVERITTMVGTLVADTDIHVELFHAAESDERVLDGEALLTEAAKRLQTVGVDPGQVSRSVVVSETPVDTLVETAADYDLVVMGEDLPSIRERIFGDTSHAVAARTVGPVLVIRRLVGEEREQ